VVEGLFCFPCGAPAGSKGGPLGRIVGGLLVSVPWHVPNLFSHVAVRGRLRLGATFGESHHFCSGKYIRCIGCFRGQRDRSKVVTKPSAEGRAQLPVQMDPAVILVVLLYAYNVGEWSSRRIERRLVDDVAFPVVAANPQPDHAALARFRARHQGRPPDCSPKGWSCVCRRDSSRRGWCSPRCSVCVPRGTRHRGRGRPSTRASGAHLGVRQLATGINVGGERLLGGRPDRTGGG
jgi:hypothetical protein